MKPMRYSCSDCKTGLQDGETACPECGSTSRNIVAVLNEELSIPDRLWLKVLGRWIKRRKRRRREREYLQGDIRSKASGTWKWYRRLIDRVNDRYEEKVIDPSTGVVVHECSEKLSEHQGHGSANRRGGAP